MLHVAPRLIKRLLRCKLHQHTYSKKSGVMNYAPQATMLLLLYSRGMHSLCMS